MKCPDCGAEMKPLAYSVFCPNDCDRRVRDEIAMEKTPRMVFRHRTPAPPDQVITFDGTIGPDDSWIDEALDDLWNDSTD